MEDGRRKEGTEGTEGKEKGTISDVSCLKFSVFEGATPIVVTFVPLGMGWK